MKIFGLGMPELIIILVVILIIFGPKNLPKLGASLGKAVKGVREGVDSVNSELEATKDSVDTVGKNKKDAKEADAPVTATAVVEDVPAAAAAAAPAAAEGAATGGFCSQCGTQFDADAKFCKKCGAANS